MLFIKRANDLGYKEKFESSYRSFKQQAQEHKADSRNSKAGFSSHNYGAGADITFIKDGKVLSKNTPQQNWIDSGLVDIAKKVGLDWGGNFKGYKDNNHFYVRGLNTSKLYSEALRQFKTTNPDKIQGNRVNIV